jgi:hypothetical protein
VTRGWNDHVPTKEIVSHDNATFGVTAKCVDQKHTAPSSKSVYAEVKSGLTSTISMPAGGRFQGSHLSAMET